MVDDDALLSLYLIIDGMKNANNNVSIDQIKGVINGAIDNAEFRLSKKLFKRLGRKNSEGGNVTLLIAEDFEKIGK